MRSFRLVPAIVAAASLLALAPAGASAHKHSNPSGRCNVNLNVAPGQITAGDAVLAFGRLRCTSPASAAGQTVQLFEHAHGTPGYALAQSTTTDARGFYEMTQAGVQSDSSFYVRSHRAQSGHRHVRVAAQVTLGGPPEGTQLLTGPPNKVTFTGTVNPADVGALVVLQRQNALTGNEWRRIDRGTVGPGGAFTIVHRFVVPGDANLRVIVRSNGVNITSPSNVLTYEISQAQNSQLTINASSDPIFFGQSVTISGVAAGAASQPVTLLARSVRQRGFAPVAEVSTNASGEYTFPPQSPVNSTFYEVAATEVPCAADPHPRACKAIINRSAVLYEGVKDVLTAAVSQSTIAAGGRTLTFTGTVAPDHTGHIIYLERQNVGNGNFHVVEVATVGAGSAYSITHRVYVPGTKVFRVRIPGGPENEGAASAPFTIQVTPAPSAALMPESPGNTGLPAEGER
ncbi:MAG TPA: hypothetical protein VGH60_03520 [Solirubrobacteraceae bacterium]|jgi:hypothetical protein